MSTNYRRSLLRATLALFVTPLALEAQCNFVSTPVGTSPDVVFAFARLHDGRLAVAGRWGATAQIGILDDGQWTAIPEPGGTRSLAVLPSGELVAGGNSVSIWNGSTWSTMGNLTGSVFTLLVRGNGELIAGGNFTSAGNRIARWDGNAWQPLGNGMNTGVYALAEDANGDLIAGGTFTTAGLVVVTRVARWQGNSWSFLSPGVGPQSAVRDLLSHPGGDLFAATDAGVARFDGTSWTSVGAPGEATSLALLPDGDVVAGWSIAANSGSVVTRWDGSTWSTVLPSLVNGSFANDLFFDGGPALYAGGTFWAQNSLQALTTQCAATADDLGGGCPSSGGANHLRTSKYAWLESDARLSATGLPTAALVTTVIGFSQFATPLALDSFLSQGIPGCSLLAVPDVIAVTVATAGRADFSFAVPAQPALIGAELFGQFVPAELGAQGIVAFTATNMIKLTVGSF